MIAAPSRESARRRRCRRARRNARAATRRGTPPRAPGPCARSTPSRRSPSTGPGETRFTRTLKYLRPTPACARPDQRRLGRRVRRAAGERALAGHRADDDDAPAPARDHPRQERPATRVDAGEVRAQRRVPVLRGDLPQRRRRPGIRRRARARPRPRTAPRRRPSRRHRRRRRRAPRLRRLAPRVPDPHPVAGERDRDRPAQPPRCTGDDDAVMPARTG